MPGISKRAWTGIAREATPGTAIVTPTLYVPTKTVFKGGKKREYLNEERGDRNMNYGVVDSVRQTAIQMKGPWYNDASVYSLLGAMGALSSAQPNAGLAPTVWKHSLTLADIPPSMTVTRSLDTKTYQVPYAVVEKWSLSFVADGKLLEHDVSLLGLFATALSSPPSPTFSTLLPFAGYAPTITLTGGASSDIIDLKLDFTQKIMLWYPANGTPDFVTAYFGERELQFDFTARFDNTTIYDRWRNNTNDTLTFDVQGTPIVKTALVTLGSPSAGTFTLTYNGQTTAGIAFNASAATVQTAFQGLSTVGANATVTGSTGGPYTITFTGGLLSDGLTVSGSGAGLTGGAFTLVPTTYAQELNIAIPVISYDSVEHDLGKENVMIKAKGKALATTAQFFSAFVQNTISGYTV